MGNPTKVSRHILDTDFDHYMASAAPPPAARKIPERTPEQNLWLAVIALEVQDATDPKLTTAAHNPESERARMQSQARNFILQEHGTTANYFESICDFAGIDADFLRRGVKKMIEEGRGIKADEIMKVYEAPDETD